MADDIVQIIENARVDATSLSEFIYYPANIMVQRRLAPSIHTLNYYLDYLHGLELVYSQPTGMVTVNGEEVKTVRQAINDSVDSVVLGDYQTQLELELTQEVDRAINREDDIVDALDTEVIRATGAEEVITQDLSELSLEVASQKLDTGITATAKFGGVARTQAEKNIESISVADFNSIEDIELSLTNRVIDMLGRTVTVSSLPTKNIYYNGQFEVDSTVYRSNLINDIQVTNRAIAIGANTPSMALDGNKTLIAIGDGAMSNISGSARSCTAIGARALKNVTGAAVYNLAVGGESQIEATTSTRNVSVGDNSLRFNKTGSANVAVGRNAGQCIIGSRNVAIGGGSMQAFGSLKFKNSSDIVNMSPITATRVTAVGTNSAFYGSGDDCTAIGAYSLEFAKKTSDSNTAIGYQAMNQMGVGVGINGGLITTYDITGSYVMTPTNVTFTFSGITAKVGDYIMVRFQTGIPLYDTISYKDPQVYEITAASGNTYTVSEPDGINASGTVKIESVEVLGGTIPASNRNVAVGRGAMALSKQGTRNIAIGSDSAINLNSNNNVSIGMYSLLHHNHLTNGDNVAVGGGALQKLQSGDDNTSSKGCVGIGNQTRVSGDNQIQLGVSGQTVYAYGAVQDRSDARDKIIEGGITDEHIAFFHDVEFKRYRLDYRDDYIVSNEDGTVTKLEKDGSKAGKREHVGVVAQQVEQAMRAHNVDFAGLQHHAQNGGNDVYTVGYQEFIPILGEIVQRQQKQIDELMALIKNKV